MGETGRTLTCPECGSAYLAGVKFCAHCGTLLSGLDAPLESEPLPPGTLVGNYRLIDLLGEGGMGRVYVAEHVKLGRRVAIKMLRSELSANPTSVARFFAEARAVNRISHENIVEITDFVEQPGGDNCIVMELLKGEDLSHRLLRKQTLPLPRALDITAQIASALSAVHNAGIIHRDLKPDNIFLIERGGSTDFVKLLDFGVAKLSDPSGQGGISVHSTAAGQILGTPEYMSPEQAGGQAIDHRTDIYSLGVILYEMLSGVLPFQAKTFGELLIKHMTAPIPLPPADPGMGHGVKGTRDALIQDLLAKDPNHRPHSMKDVEKRMRELIEMMDLPPPPKKRATTSGSQIAIREKSESDQPRTKSTNAPAGAVAKIPLAKRPTPEPRNIAAVAAELAPAGAVAEPRRARSEPVPVIKEESARLAMSSTEAEALDKRLARSSTEGTPIERHTPVPRVTPEHAKERITPKPLSMPDAPARPRTQSSEPAVARTTTPTRSLVRPKTDGKDGSKETGAQVAIRASGTRVSHFRRNMLIGGGVLAVAVVIAVLASGGGNHAATPDATAEIKIKFVSTPSGATVRVAGTSEVLGTTPFTKAFPKSDLVVAFQFEKEGYTSETEQIALAGDDAVAAALPPVVAAPPAAVAPPSEVPPPVAHPPVASAPRPVAGSAHRSGSGSGSGSTGSAQAGSAIERNGTMSVFGK